MVMFVGLNPSTADAAKDDPTVRRCAGFARRWGFGGLYLVNLFACRATDPALFASIPDPVGPDNNAVIARTALGADMVVAAWGNLGHASERSHDVLAMLQRRVYCLDCTARGAPRHPLYARGDLVPRLFYGPEDNAG